MNMPYFSKREINELLLGVLFLVLFFAYLLGVTAVLDKRDNLKRILNEKQTALEEMVLLRQQYLAVSNNFDSKTQALAARNKGFSLFSFLDFLAQQSGVKENVAYMKPFTKKLEKSIYTLATVKVKLQEVRLKKLVDYLYHIESSKNGVTITSLSLSKAGKQKLMLDAVIETQTLVLKEKG